MPMPSNATPEDCVTSWKVKPPAFLYRPGRAVPAADALASTRSGLPSVQPSTKCTGSGASLGFPSGVPWSAQSAPQEFRHSKYSCRSIGL